MTNIVRSLLNDPEVANLRYDRLQRLAETLGYSTTLWQFDGGQTVWVETPVGVFKGSVEWGDGFTAAGLAFARLVEADLIPEGAMEVVIPARY